jgi:hypothetical protein
MTLTCCVQRWAPGEFNWLSSNPTALGMRLHEAFTAFAAAVNPTEGNEDLHLTALRSHADATGSTSYGFCWRLGHPVNPLVVSFHNVSIVQGYSASSSSALLRIGLAADLIDDTSNGGYGAFTVTIVSINRGLSHYGPAGSPAIAGLEGVLVVAFDDTPGAEFFSATFGRLGGDTYSQNLTVMLFRSPATSGWNFWFHRARAYVGLSGTHDRYSWVGDTPQQVSPAGGAYQLQQLNSPGEWWRPVSNSGPITWNTAVPRLLLPSFFWIGDNQKDDVRRLGRFADPGGGGTFYQLGSSGGYTDDLWFRLPSSPSPVVLTGWSSIGSLPWTTLGDRLSVVPLPIDPVALVGAAAGSDGVTDWSATAAGIGGMQQHPLYSQQPAGSGGGGNGRPAAGVLWPRRT